MTAQHFRERAARAREMAKNGDDIYVSRMLLEVAAELEREADLIDLETSNYAQTVLPPQAEALSQP